MATLKSIKNKYLGATDGTVLGVTTNTENIAALSFKLATADSLSKFNLVDGFSDDYNDATGVDASNSTNEVRDSTNKYFAGTLNSNDAFSYTGADQTWTAPNGFSSVTVRLWGAGGGSEGSNLGGGGGFVKGTLNITGGNNYKVIVGQGGGTNGAAISYGSGGRGGSSAGTGGSRSAIRTSSGTADLVTAGSGGGSGATGSGGGGGGTTGKPGTGYLSNGSGGTQSAGGSSHGSAAGQYDGGDAHPYGSLSNSGGGGSGWYGGGSGGNRNDVHFGGGGGGSSYVTGLSATETNAQGETAGQGAGQGDSQWVSGVGNGGASGTQSGQPGRVVFSYSAYNDMTLISNAFTAQAAPTTARIVLDEESAEGDTVLNTDLKAYASRDNGTTFTQMTLASQATLTDTSTLLMHMDGANDGTVFTDSARPSLTVTRAGTPVTKTAEKKFGTASCYLAGTTDWLKLPASDNWSFAAGADFTVECWCKWSTAAAYVGMISSKTEISSVYNGWSLRTDASGSDKILSFNFWNNSGSVTFACNGTSNIGDGSWHHVAATRASNTVRVFVDGALENSGTYSGAINGTSSGGYGLQIGMDYLNATGSGPMHGYVDEVRISNVARWTAAFTPPTAAYSGYEGDRQLLSGSVDISGQPSGTNMKYKIETLNQASTKQTRVYGTSMAWA